MKATKNAAHFPRVRLGRLASLATIKRALVSFSVLALIALGYKQVDAHKAVRDLQTQGQAKSAEELVKLALKKMASGR